MVLGRPCNQKTSRKNNSTTWEAEDLDEMAKKWANLANLLTTT